MNNNEIEEYLQKGEYAGIVEGNYDFYCPLKLEEINNFVQNVGIYTNIAIIRGTDEDEDVLFNTYGTYINRMWPELSLSDRDAFQSTINMMAGRLVEEFDKDKQTEVLSKVEKFLTETLDVDMKEHMDRKEIYNAMSEMEMQVIL